MVRIPHRITLNAFRTNPHYAYKGEQDFTYVQTDFGNPP